MSAMTAPSAEAKWGPYKECGGEAEPELQHCYALAERNTTKYGGVLASIDFVDTDYNTYPTVSIPANYPSKEDFVTMEQWISFPAAKDEGWIETGQVMGEGSEAGERVHIHPFVDELIFFGSYYNKGKGTWIEDFSEAEEPAGGPAFTKKDPSEEAYNHYVLFDSERNGRWHFYWGSTEIGYYGGGWPEYLTEQEAGVEAADENQPTEYGRQEVAASDGGEWTPWTGDSWYHDPAMCIESNEESSAAGDIEFSTCG